MQFIEFNEANLKVAVVASSKLKPHYGNVLNSKHQPISYYLIIPQCQDVNRTAALSCNNILHYSVTAVKI